MKLFGRKTVDDVVAMFDEIVKDLDEVAAHNSIRSGELAAEAEKLHKEADACRSEAIRARAVMDNINRLLGSV